MSSSSDSPASPRQRITLRSLHHWVRLGKKFPMLTCYDATSARWLASASIPTLLVGDTAAQMILGHDSTLPAPMPFMLEITAAVRRGAPDAFIMADMPFGSYQCSADDAMRNASAFMANAGADCVKLEVDSSFAPLVERMTHAGIPVVAHLGSRPQQVRAQGGFHSAGRTRADADQVISDAQLMIHKGFAMILLEAVPNELSAKVVELAMAASKLPGRHGPVPVIGCGAGSACHGHVVVLHDLLGLSSWHPPFVQPAAALGEEIAKAARHWLELVESGRYLLNDHPYKMQ